MHTNHEERRIAVVLIDKQSRVPAYEQIRNQLLTLILIGSFAPHSQLPSIRSIAADAGVNINTVKKAFSDLESYGAIYTVPGKGSFVSEKAFKSDTVHDTAVSEISDAISAARAKGLKKQEIIDILNEIYTQEEES
jgi:GntR family transcriptional regulator